MRNAPKTFMIKGRLRVLQRGDTLPSSGSRCGGALTAAAARADPAWGTPAPRAEPSRAKAEAESYVGSCAESVGSLGAHVVAIGARGARCVPCARGSSQTQAQLALVRLHSSLASLPSTPPALPPPPPSSSRPLNRVGAEIRPLAPHSDRIDLFR